MFQSIRQWIHDHQMLWGMPLWLWIILGTMAMALVSVAVTIAAIVRIPADYFHSSYRDDWHAAQHPLARLFLRILRNLLGVGLIVLGVLLSLPGIPGQGLLTILLGLMLVDFPGKRRLEQKIVRRPGIRKVIDAARVRAGREPLIIDE